MGHNHVHDFRLEVFEPEMTQGLPSARSQGFSQALARGFHDVPAGAAEQKILTEVDLADQVVYTAVYDDAAPGHSLHATLPVGTYLAFPGSLNVGGPTPLPVHQISGVTVSPTHRRRGILRSMITADLHRAAQLQMPLAALTATEATIYGRFGFGRATERVRFELDVSSGAAMRSAVTGRILAVEPQELEPLLYNLGQAEHLTTLGSLRRNSFERSLALGRITSSANLKPATGLRAAVHLNERGEPDGFITYTFAGWETKPLRIDIGILCASNARARWELIEYLGAHDLIEKVTGRGALDDILPTALLNSRHYKVTSVSDHLWLRILDLPAALSGRTYHTAGSVRLKVSDQLGYTAGTWQLNTEHGAATITQQPADSAHDATLDVRELATLYLGTRSASHLAEAGLLTAADTATLHTLDELFRCQDTPYCDSDF